MRKFLRRLHKNSKAGFTLAEMMIVVAITAVLAAFAFGQVSAYQKKLRRTEMDNAAREIFVAAQNHLTASKANGTWAASFYNGTTKYITGTSYQVFIADKYIISDYVPAFADDLQDSPMHAFYYVVYNSTTYKNALTDDNSVLTQLLPYGSIDETLRAGGSYIIEFDAATQSIYSVFYTADGSFNADSINTLNGTSLADGYRGDTNASKREKYSFATGDAAIGYYGGAVAIKNTNIDWKAPVITINNGKVLEAVVTDSNYDEHKTMLQLMITQTSGNGTKTDVKINFDLNTGKATNADSAKRYINETNFNSNGVWSATTVNGSKVYHIVLDNILKTGTHFADLIDPTIVAPGSNIEVVANICDGSFSNVVISDGASTNSLYNVVNSTDNSNIKYEAVISNERHLANLSTNISNYSPNQSKFIITSATLSQDTAASPVVLDWDSFTTEGTGSNAKKVNETYALSTNTVKDSRFLSISNIPLKTFKGNGSTLQNFNILSNGQESGLFASVSAFTISDLNLIDFKSYASKNCGALIGTISADTNTTQIKNVHVYDSDRTKYGSTSVLLQISAGQSAGGLVGEIVGKTNIVSSSASVKVGRTTELTSTTTAGGLIGRISGNVPVTISNSYVGGKIDDYAYKMDTADDANITGTIAGGFIGSITNGTITVTDSYTTASVYGTNSKGGTDYTGGLVGNIVRGNSNSTLTLSNVYVSNAIAGSGVKRIGLYIGNSYNSNALKVSSTSYVQSGLTDMTAFISNISNVNYNNIKSKTPSQLKAIAGTNNSGSAAPYYTDLGTVYPYALTKNDAGEKIANHGDWLAIDSTNRVSLTKEIHFTSQIGDATAKEEALAEIRKYTSFVFTDSKGNATTYPFDADNVTVVKTNYGYKLTIPAAMDFGTKYTVEEITDIHLENQYVFISTNYSYEFYNIVSGTVPAGRSGSDTYNTKIAADNFKLATNEGVRINFSNSYQKYTSGLYYYETYSDGSSYLQGYSNTTKVGVNDGFERKSTTTVEHSGYVYVVSNLQYDWAGYQGNTEDVISVYLNSGYDNFANPEYWKSISALKADKYISDLPQNLASQLSLDNCHAYSINFDEADLDNYSGWQSIWNTTGWSWISMGVIDSDAKIPLPYGTYSLNPYYADAVSIVVNPELSIKGNNGNTRDKLSARIRTADQLKSIIRHDGNYTLNRGWTAVNNNVTQELNIDLKSSSDTISMVTGATYQGVTFTDTKEYPTISGIGNTLFGLVNSNSKIMNLNVTTTIENAVHLVNQNYYYGSFINSNWGTLSNVGFVNCSFKNSQIGSDLYWFASVGYVGYNSGTLSDITIKNSTWNNSRFYSSYSGFLPYSNSGKCNNISISNSKWDDLVFYSKYTGFVNAPYGATLTGLKVTDSTFNNVYASGTDFGIIGFNASIADGYAITNTNWTNVWGQLTNLGVIAEDVNSTSNLTISGMTWTNDTAHPIISHNVGVIGFTLEQTNLTNTNISDITWSNLSADSYYFGITGDMETQTSTLLNISNVRFNDLTLTPYYYSGRSFGIIPYVEHKADQTTVKDVVLTNIQSSMTHNGIIGQIYGSMTNTSISQAMIHNSDASPATITGLTCGMIGYVDAGGQVIGITVSKDVSSADPYGFTMDNLKLNVQYWGVIADNEGKVYGYNDTNSSISDVKLTNIDTSSAIKTLSTKYFQYAGGIIGKNFFAERITIYDVEISNIKLPKAKNSIAFPCIGIVGYNAGRIGEEYIDESGLSVTSYKMSNFNIVDTTSGISTEFIKYKFVDWNGSYSNYAEIYNSSITYDPNLAGYGVYNVNYGVIDSMTVNGVKWAIIP